MEAYKCNPYIYDGRQITLTINQLPYWVILENYKKGVFFKNMYNFLISNNLLYKYQSGFLPHHSTAIQLIDIFVLMYVKLLIIICLLVLCSMMF